MNRTQQEIADSVYRIMSFDRLIEIFKTGELFLSHPSNWDDPYETFLPHKHEAAFFAQCWCKNGVSDAMWRIYSPNQLGVRIRTTRTILASELAEASKKMKFRFHILDVNYVPQSVLSSRIHAAGSRLAKRFNQTVASKALALKREAFAHEAEVRVVAHPVSLKGEFRPSNGIRVPIDPFNLIRGILVDPRAPDAFVEAYSVYLKSKVGYKRPVRRSLLYAGPEPLDVP